ncbi:MAG: TIGR04551 family protein [Myxococcales bacterium]|nr:TIGR04551 family protein [Myxococcales bacterium]
MLLLAASPAAAQGFRDIGLDIEAARETKVVFAGALRARAEGLYNLDLDRGPTPSGDPLFPVPLSDPSAQWLSHADMRLRTDVALLVPRAGMAVRVRLDALDNLSLGSQPEGVPSVAVSQRPADQPFVIRRAYAEALTPFGMLAVGRMGNHWGLGMLANGGDCADCDSGDAADRVAFVSPFLGHVWAVAFDWTSIGPTTQRNAPGRVVALDPWDNVRTFTFAVLDFHTDLARRRRARAGRTSVEYGAYVSHRWQHGDVPASYLPLASPVAIDRAQSMHRGFRATAVDGWLKVTLPFGRIELEAAYLRARIEQPSLVPGVELRQPLRSDQIGAALETDFGPGHGEGRSTWSVGLDAGFASGDPSPGFGAQLGRNARGPNAPAPRPGDLDGPQARPPFDNRVDNFRFHSDYRIDRILFREIIGTVTDAVYVRPHARVRLAELGPGRLEAHVAAIASFAVQPTSTPGGERPLGLEVDPTIVYATREGFLASLEYAVLFPFAGFDNPVLGLGARPAQLLRLRLGFHY